MEPLKIVLTGGPSAGKTTIIKSISQDKFNIDNLIFFFVSETATDLMKSNIKVSHGFSEYDFQTQVFQVQLSKENYYINLASKYYTTSNVVIIYDRGLLDGAVYIDEKQSRQIFGKQNMTFEDVHKRYDAVIHLESAAKNTGYTTENNSTRRETLNEAIQVENHTLEMNKQYIPQDKLYVVSACGDFEEKINNVIGIISDIMAKKFNNKTNKNKEMDDDDQKRGNN